MTPEENRLPEQPIRHAEGMSEVDHEQRASGSIGAGQHVERKQAAAFTPETQQALDAHIAKSFVENAPVIMSYFANCLMPPGLQDQNFDDLMQDSDFDFRGRVIAERNAVYDILIRGRDIAEQLKAEVREDGDREIISRVVSTDLAQLAEDALATVERLKELNTEILTAINDIRVREFPGRNSVEAQRGEQFENLQEYFKYRDERCVFDPKEGVILPLNAYGALWETVLYSDKDPEQFDANSAITLNLLLNRSAKVTVSEEEPVVACRKSDFALLACGASTFLEESVRAVSNEYLKEIGAGNALFDRMQEAEFADSAECSFLMNLFTEGRDKSIAVSDDGGLTVSTSAPDEILARLQEQVTSWKGFGAVIQEVCARNHINVSVSCEDGEISLFFQPIVISSNGDGPLEDLKKSYGAKNLGLVPKNELGIPDHDAMPDEPEVDPEHEMAERESRMLLIDREIAGGRESGPGYLLGFQAAGLSSAEAGAQVNELAARVDEFMKVFPAAEGVILQKLDLRDGRQRDGDEPVIMQHRYAEPVSEAYRKGKIDFASFGEAVDLFDLPEPQSWARTLGKALAGSFSWVNDEEVLDISAVQDTGADADDEDPLGVGMLLDGESLKDDAVLAALQNLSDIGNFKQLSLHNEALEEVMRGKYNGVFTTLDLLAETEKVVRDVAQSFAGQRLTISLQDTLLDLGGKRGNLERSYRLLVHGDDGKLVAKGHFNPKQASFTYKEVEPIEIQQFTERFENAVEHLVSERALRDFTVRRLAKVLVAEGLSIETPGTDRELIDRIRKSGEPEALARPLRKALLKEASIHDIVDALEENGVELEDLLSSQLLMGFLRKGGESVPVKKLMEQLLYRPGVYIESADDVLSIRKFDDDELKHSSAKIAD